MDEQVSHCCGDRLVCMKCGTTCSPIRNKDREKIKDKMISLVGDTYDDVASGVFRSALEEALKYWEKNK